MISESPPFWWTKADWRAWALSLFSFLYGRVASYRMARGKRASVPLPVICVGNFTVGGAGKTPTAIAIARAARKKGLKPGFLSRGYGGSLDVTTLVDPDHHRAMDVGDEPLLLAREALTVVSRRRVEGARRLVGEGVDLIIMDDGFQSTRLAIDYALVVIDTMRGIGNSHIVPGGPVRAPISLQLRHASALLKVGNGHAIDGLVRRAARAGKSIFVASLRPCHDGELDGQKVLAFAGIADPDKFFRTVESLGADIRLRRAFGDHQQLSDDEIADLISDADRERLQLVTTTKDIVRLARHHGHAAELAACCRVVEVEMAFDDPDALDRIIDAAIHAARLRKLRRTRKA